MNIKILKSMNNKLTEVIINDLTLYFSYETIIGFHTPQTGIIATENLWNQTTGRHLNSFSMPEDRKPRSEFMELLQGTLKKYGL